jgi:hypothetical protein
MRAVAGRSAEGRDRRGGPDWTKPARHAIARAERAGMIGYERHRHLPALIGLDPELLSDDSLSAAVLILGRLRRALRAERRRAGSGHWTYDLNRHIALRQAYAAERRRWAELKKGAPSRSRRPSS